MPDILNIMKDQSLTFHQRFTAMAKAAEDSIDPIAVSEQTKWCIENNLFFDMREGKAPYRPRYITPDYDLFMKQGSEFLMIDPPQDIWEAVSALLILYHNVPSASGTPVYIGHLDRLLEPFIKEEETAIRAIRMLLTHVDRTIRDAFCHCDIGPFDTKAGRIILDLTKEMERPVPNMSLIYNENTPDDFACKAIETGLVTAKPSFVNDRMYTADWGSQYAVASCYNVLPIGGGGSTLCRFNMKELALHAKSLTHLTEELLPLAANCMCELMDERIKFIYDDCQFFENSFLTREGLIYKDRFVGMFGLVGLAECVNITLEAKCEEERFGFCEKATLLGEQLMDQLQSIVSNYKPKYGKFYLHAQVGVEDDNQVTPGTRIPVLEKVELVKHLAITAKMHKNFATGTGDLYPFDETAKKNPAYILDIIKGSFAQDMRYFSFYSDDSDVMRITGYLVKRSDMKKREEGMAVLENATVLGIGAAKVGHILERKVNGF